MMRATLTLDIVIVQAYLKELDALTRVRRAIVSHRDMDSAWVYAVAALDARLSALRDLLAREDPHVLRAARLAETPDTPEPMLSRDSDLPTGTRVH